MTTLRHLGECPCPRCAVKLANVYLIGTKSDRKVRTTTRRVDDEKYRKAISLARNAIYEKNDTVDSAYVERQLKEMSWVPTSVRHLLLVYSPPYSPSY